MGQGTATVAAIRQEMSDVTAKLIVMTAEDELTYARNMSPETQVNRWAPQEDLLTYYTYDSLTLGFFTPAHCLICPRCKSILANPKTIQCGHSVCFMCAECLETLHHRAPSCPVCKNEAQTLVSTRENHNIQLLVDQLKVKCPKRGCPAVVILDSLRQHLYHCRFGWQ